MRAFEAVVGTSWAIEPGALTTLLSVAAREGDPEAVAARLGRRLENTRSVTVRDGVAVIPVLGPVFRRANLFTEISGATSIEVLAGDLQRALDDPAVKAVLLDVDSPGGEVNGTGEFAGMVRKARERKPVRAYVGGTGASGAYYIASAAEEVVVSPSAVVGSIGVVMVWRNQLRDGEVELVSSQSPLKRATPETEEGRTELQRVVDALARVFVRDVARFRGVTEEQVLAQFGAGGLLVGEAAVAAGMADRVGTFEEVIFELTAETQRTQRGRIGGKAPELQSANCKVQIANSGGKEAGMEGGGVAEAGTQVVGRDELSALQTRLEAAEREAAAARAETAGLVAQAARRGVDEALATLRFPVGTGEMAFTPESRVSLGDALMGLDGSARTAVLGAIGCAKVYAVGTVGHGGGEDAGNGAADAVQLTAADRQAIEEEARRKRVPASEVEAAWRQVRRDRAARMVVG